MTEPRGQCFCEACRNLDNGALSCTKDVTISNSSRVATLKSTTCCNHSKCPTRDSNPLRIKPSPTLFITSPHVYDDHQCNECERGARITFEKCSCPPTDAAYDLYKFNFSRSLYFALPRLRTYLKLVYFLQLFFFPATIGSGVWWSPGKGRNLVNSSRLCSWSRQVGGSHLDMCLGERVVVNQIQKGIENAISSCQKELRFHRWNCTQRNKAYFARIMTQDIREAGFVRALTAAAITHQVTSACANGEISQCQCSNPRKLRKRLLRLEAQRRNVTVNEDRLRAAVDKFKWGGCRDNVEFGLMKSREFLDVTRLPGTRRKSMMSEKIQTHNEETGRRAIRNHMKRTCACHGLTSSCTMWTCWKVMPPFVEVSRRLRSKYTTAVRVMSKNDGKSLAAYKRRRRKTKKRRRRVRSAEARSRDPRSQRRRRVRARAPSLVRRRLSRQRKTRKRLSSDDIIFFRKSPDFCKTHKKRGSMGTSGRRCDLSSGNCDYLCCGRGYRTVNFIEATDCQCSFKFCCDVDCNTCLNNVTLRYCN